MFGEWRKKGNELESSARTGKGSSSERRSPFASSEIAMVPPSDLQHYENSMQYNMRYVRSRFVAESNF